jgi:hypothetical protein
MGQTDIGSFVITAYTPAAQRFYISRSAQESTADRQGLPWGESDSLTGRAILETFVRALKSVRSGLDEYKRRPEINLFLATVEDGVSYELTKALGETTRSGDAAIQISLQVPGTDRQTVTEVAFDSVEAPILDSVANSFALDPEPQDVTLVGEVTLLSRSLGIPDRVVRLDIEEGAEIRKARVRLSADQYDQALEAHRQEASLRVSGSLEREGRLYWLYGANNVSVVPNETDRRATASGTPIEARPLFDDNE